MGGRIDEFDSLRAYMRQMWVRYVRKSHEDADKQMGFKDRTIENTLMLYGGQPPGAGYPPDWPKETMLIEDEVRRLIPAQKVALKLDMNVIRKPVQREVGDEGIVIVDYEKYDIKEKCAIAGMSKSKFYSVAYGAYSALWQPVTLRRLVEAA